MVAIKKEKLEELEKQYGLEQGELTYQKRCSRITAYQKGEGERWEEEEKQKAEKEQRKAEILKKYPHLQQSVLDASCPIYGHKFIITPLMKPDAKRNLAYDEVLGYDIVARDFNAGEAIYGAAEDVQRMVGDYEVVRVDKSKQVVAKTTFPKIGTEISWTAGVDLVPVARGNDGKRGYVWSFPTSVYRAGDYLIQLYGLKTLIRQIYPELEKEFSGKPMMDYIDGITLAASIPQTHTLLKKHAREEAIAEKAGLGGFGGLI